MQLFQKSALLLLVAIIWSALACAQTDGKSEPVLPPKTTVGIDGFEAQSFLERMPALKKQLLESLGLEASQKRPPLNSKILGMLDAEDFVVQKLEYESKPGFPVTAHLYLPKKRKGRVPAVLNPHGHWPGAKRSEQVRMRCAQMARMGLVAMAIDMYGSPGVGNERAHLGGHYDNPDLKEGISGYQMAAGISIAGISVYDAIRAIDYLQSRPEVDSGKIITCGASFGATVALMTGIVDERVWGVIACCYGSSFTHYPANNSSELVPGILKDTTQQQMLALVAPRRLLLIQHTHDNYSEPPVIAATVRRVYKTLGATKRFSYEVHTGRHDFDKPKREIAYRWLSKELFGKQEPVFENAFYPFHPDRLYCFEERRVGADAITTDALINQVEETVNKKWTEMSATQNGSKRKNAYLQKLKGKLGFSEKPDPAEASLFRISFVNPESVDLEKDTWQSGYGALCLAPEGHAGGGVVKVFPSGTTYWEARDFLATQTGKNLAACAVRLDGAEVVLTGARGNWVLDGLSPDQIRYGANVMSLIEGRPVVYTKVRMLARTVSRLVDEAPVNSRQVVLQGNGDDANLLLLLGVFVSPYGGLELTDPLLSYVRKGEGVPPMAITPAGILQEVDIFHLASLLAPARLTITAGHLADGSRPGLLARKRLLQPALEAYHEFGKEKNLVIE